jgi:integrase
MVERAGSEAKLGFKAHPHMLRHACGYALANKGHDTRALQAYLGYSLRRIRVRARSVRPRSAPSSVLQLGPLDTIEYA